MRYFATLVCAAALTSAVTAQNTVVEKRLYTTNFQDWDAVSSTTTPTTKQVVTKGSKENLAITFAEVQINPTGTHDRFTNYEVITAGYAMGAKSATPYIETSVLASVTRVTYVHAATGSTRGWGLLCKSAEATQWDTLWTTPCQMAGTAVEVAVNRENVQLRWYNLNNAQNAYMTEFAIYGNVEVAPRTFTDFEIDLTKEEVVLPAGVQGSGASYNGAMHGWIDYTIGFKTDGPVRMTFGGCEYADKAATVTSYTTGAVLATVDTKSAGCYHNGGTATWTYNVEEADSLIVYLGQYSPYFKAVACEYTESHTVMYFDQEGLLLGTETVEHGTPFSALYTADIEVPEGYAFRGWANNTGIKVATGTAVENDLKVYALVTETETAETGKFYTYDMTAPSWYAEDHEGISITGGAYYNNHGWKLNQGSMVALPVAGNAYVQVKNCSYSKAGEVTAVAKKSGAEVARFDAVAASDGAAYTFFYGGAADTLVLTFAAETYLHGITIYHVAGAVEKESVSGMYIVPAGDAGSLVLTLLQAQAGDRIFLPNGIYDLGETVLTQLSAGNVSLIGQSRDGVIIRNAPDARNECIDKTATLLLTGNDIYLQDLTLQNALDYYKNNNGRAVALWDKGTRTICKNVRLLSYQDTYYSNKIGAVRYFEGGSIHGTVDYICGDGSVYFNRVELFCEKRNSTGGGSDAVTASNADTRDKGYAFEGCRLLSECPTVSLGRAWNNAPQCVFMNTVFDYSAGNFSLTDGTKIQRWTCETMSDNVFPVCFGEYNSTDTDGNPVSPESNVVTFSRKGVTKTMETILTQAEVSAAYTYDAFFGPFGWNPAADARQAIIWYTLQDGNIVWAPTTATLFLIEYEDGRFVFASELPAALEEGMTVRAANGRGGFGPAATEGEPTGFFQPAGTVTPAQAEKRIENGHLVIVRDGVRYSALGTVL